MKKTLKILGIIYCITLFYGCKTNSYDSIDVFFINPDDASYVNLKNIATDIKVIGLDFPDTIIFGDIEHIKSTNKKIFLYDQYQTNSITVFDEKGQFISQLKKIGKGPGEYSSIDAFAFDEKNDELIIFEMGRGFKFYSFPEFSYLRDYKVNEYFLNIEVIGDHLLTVSDTEITETKCKGVELFNFNSGEYINLGLPGNPVTIDLSHPNTIVRHDNQYIYASPGFTTNIYQISEKGSNIISKVDFGEFNIPKEAWSFTFDQAMDFRTIFSSSPKATWVQNVIIDDLHFSFYYVFKNIFNRYFAVCNINSKKCHDYSGIYLHDNFEVIPYPSGVFRDYYISIIYPEFIEDILPEDKETLKYWQIEINNHRNSEKPVLLMYKLI